MGAPMPMPATLLASRYNFSFVHGERVVLFNGRTGVSWVLEGEAAASLGAELSSAVQAWSSEAGKRTCSIGSFRAGFSSIPTSTRSRRCAADSGMPGEKHRW